MLLFPTIRYVKEREYPRTRVRIQDTERSHACCFTGASHIGTIGTSNYSGHCTARRPIRGELLLPNKNNHANRLQPTTSTTPLTPYKHGHRPAVWCGSSFEHPIHVDFAYRRTTKAQSPHPSQTLLTGTLLQRECIVRHCVIVCRHKEGIQQQNKRCSAGWGEDNGPGQRR